MAKSWCGFLPQNQRVIEQWGYMEASTSDILEALRALRFFEEDEALAGFDPDNDWEKL
jgi:hypothetical protein